MEKFSLSRERVRQIERSALVKLRKMKYVKELRDFLN
jgi:DNA-directed RNA polymerase sigma subunit (sigma70/sigma32)